MRSLSCIRGGGDHRKPKRERNIKQSQDRNKLKPLISYCYIIVKLISELRYTNRIIKVSILKAFAERKVIAKFAKDKYRNYFKLHFCILKSGFI